MANYSGYKPDSKIYLIPEPVDFRKSVDGLTMIIQEILKMDPMEKACFMFSNKQHDKIKIIEWDFNGFWLAYKRLEGEKFKWPKSAEPVIPISREQYNWLMNGLNIDQRDGFSQVLARKVI